MLGFNYFTLYTVLLGINQTLASHTLVYRAIQKVQDGAIRHTHSLANDLRVAFSSVLLSRADGAHPDRVVYCKSGKQATFGNGNTGSSSNSSTSSSGTASMPASTSSATSSSKSATNTKGTSSAAPSSTSTPSPWTLIETHEGDNFFAGWNFFTGGDPTNGIVTYVDQNTASSSGLLEVNSQGHAIMRVETTPVVSGNRKSVRITTQRQFNGGLVIMDSIHMPTGCGVWPAFWTNGPNWPVTGEIDIVEGVHDYTNNQATVHTNVGCTLASSNADTLSISGTVIGGTDCAALTTGNQGCGIRASTSNSFGAGFNSNGGGVFAMKWDTSGIAVYFFPANAVPSDITAETPQPDSWGAAQARWPATSCDPFKFFIDHSAIFDTTLCGDWAGGVWNVAGIPGQAQSCAQRTGVSTCQAYVQNNGAALAEAYWEVRSVKLYQLQN
ncbi:hypothetical protein BDN70DRAFT_888989 [Pholiota conissans]|uniref:GH16 domain-containing protein n=1 Tax=Pholiota conissans TaxID=109636 RepID=A0A9P5YMX3_9AGAR|nr:hypothetical protein BDN70DRAFT_888989 [Pholiota conissans]